MKLTQAGCSKERKLVEMNQVIYVLGYSISLSADGMTLAIGSYWDDENRLNSGQVRVFTME